MHHADSQRGGVVGVFDGHHFPVFADLSGVWLIHAEENGHQRGFPGTVFAQQRMDFAPLELEGNVVIGFDTRKLLGYVEHLDHIVLPMVHSVTYFPLFS